VIDHTNTWRVIDDSELVYLAYFFGTTKEREYIFNDALDRRRRYRCWGDARSHGH